MKDYFGYKGKVCVVTGAASGMGRATCEACVDLGAIVYALDRNRVDVPGATFIQVNLDEKASIDAAFAKLPAYIDKFFGVAGLSGHKTDWHTTFIVNFIANKYIAENFLINRMKEGSAIVFTTSTGGSLWEKYSYEYIDVIKAKDWDEMIAAMESWNQKDVPGNPGSYRISKRALNYYTRDAVAMFGPKKIRVNGILPGSTDTGMKDEFAKSVGGLDVLITHSGYAGKLAEPQNMGEPMVFLNSDMAEYISGVLIPVDFGNRAITEMDNGGAEFCDTEYLVKK